MARQLTIVIGSPTRTAHEFEALAVQAARLQRHGQVAMGVFSQAEPSRADVPPGGSPWHDYTSYLPSLEKFVPHKDMVPFLDREHIARNRQLLRDKVAILRKHKMGAAVGFHAPWYLPEGFFEKYPHRRGPRIDHPRRSKQEAYALCADLPENLAIWGEMFAELIKEVPELSTVHVSTNDAGGGFCWADWLYSGPNGPIECRGRGMGQRVRGLIDAFRKAAPKNDIDFDVSGNFSETELQAVARFHDDKFHCRAQRGGNPRHAGVGSHAENPVLGLFNPLGLLSGLDRLKDPQVNHLSVGFGANYARGHDLPEISEKVIEVVDAFLAEPSYGLLSRLQFARRLCAKWVGEEQADLLLEAFYDMQRAFEYREATTPRFTVNYCGVSMRHINRPLVAIPERLSEEEKSYWLPHVFNPSQHEALVDYIDWHGGRLSGPQDIDQGADPRILPLDQFHARLNRVADKLESLDGDSAELFRRMGTSLRIHASILRSVNNCYGLQKIRDRNRHRLSGEPRTPTKDANWTGDADLQFINAFMRDELDNTTRLIRLLENGGMRQVLTARDPAEEDTFLLGPDLINQLKQKRVIMRRHWLDAEQYLSSPHK